MLEIDYSKIPAEDLREMITRAAGELAARARAPTTYQRPDPPAKIVEIPTAQDLATIRSVLRDLLAGAVILAREKDEYAALARQYKSWFEMKRLPASVRRDTRTFIKRGVIP